MRIWVVGGTYGIGLETTRVLTSAGHFVRASGSETDVRSARLLREYAATLGPFDALVYSAGVNYLEWSDNLDCDKAAEVYDINVLGLVRVLQALLAADCDLQRVVVVGSDAAWRPMRTSLPYNASKAALHAAVQCIARERASENFAINVVAPGLVEATGMTDDVLTQTKEVRGWDVDRTLKYMVDGIPLGRPIDPIEVAYVIRDVLESPPAVNGAIIPVNGAR